MKSFIKSYIKSFTIYAVLCTSTIAFGEKYKIDESHSEVGFKVKHLMITNSKGRFDKFEGSFDFDSKTGQIKNLDVKIDTDSVNTNKADRDKHLKNDDFFGVRTEKGKLVDANRWMIFKSSKGEVKEGKPAQMAGQLTIKGTTKDVNLDVTYTGSGKDPWGNSRVGFEATTKVNRKDFGLNWNKSLDAGGVVLGEEVDVFIAGEAILEAPKKDDQKMADKKDSDKKESSTKK